MLENLTLATFSPLVGETFRLHVPPAHVLDLVLVEATPIVAESPAHAANRRKTPFTLIFNGPPHVVASQHMYPIEHETLGRYELFVVPIGPKHGAMQYQVIFT